MSRVPPLASGSSMRITSAPEGTSTVMSAWPAEITCRFAREAWAPFFAASSGEMPTQIQTSPSAEDSAPSAPPLHVPLKRARYTPALVKAQLICVWASMGRSMASVRAETPSDESKTRWGSPNVPVTYPCRAPGPSLSARARRTCVRRPAPRSRPATRRPSHTVSRERFSTSGMIVAPRVEASSASARCVEPAGRFASIVRISACSSSMR